jgi:hypothetical protein
MDFDLFVFGIRAPGIFNVGSFGQGQTTVKLRRTAAPIKAARLKAATTETFF